MATEKPQHTELLKKICVQQTATLRHTMKAIDDGGVNIAIVLEGKRLAGTASDGDCRRAILRGVGLDAPVLEVMNRKPLTTTEGEEPSRVMDVMLRNSVRQIPVVDRDGALIDIQLLEELVRPTPRDNWAIVMAGGLGERLRPYTQSVPKPMLMVGNQPILERVVRQLKLHSFQKVFVSVNHLAEKIEGYFQDGSAFGMDIAYLREEERLGTAGALRLLPSRPEKPFVVMNADLLTEISFSQLLDFHSEEQAALTLCVASYDINIPYGVVQLDGTRVRGIEEKPTRSHFISAGIYVLEPRCLDLIPSGKPFDMPTLIDALLQKGERVAGFPIRESWLDVGQLHDYQNAVLRALQRSN